MINSEQEMMLYIHIPFCLKKCNYCDFLSAPAGRKMQEQYTKALIREIEREAVFYQDYRVDTVFFGGGTPSVLESSYLKEIMQTIKRHFEISNQTEISMELNPGTVDRNKLNIYRNMGINRLSIGAQSINNKELQLLGRIHDAEDFYRTYEESRKAGFDNINVDIMSALPGQTMEDYKTTLKGVVCLEPEHISAYSLIIEEGTPFYELYGKKEAKQNGKKEESKLTLPSEELERAMYYETCSYLEQNGYHHYEISNFAKDGRACRHNTGYWQRKNYLGLGLGAASLIQNVRWNNPSNQTEYLNDGKHTKQQMLTISEQMEEFMFLGLRMMEGVSDKRFFYLFGKKLCEVYGDSIDKMIKQKLIVWKEVNGEQRLTLTKYGIDISNYVFSEFLF